MNEAAFLDAAGAELYATSVAKSCPLKVRVSTALAGWVELRSTHTVAVATAHLRSFIALCASFHVAIDTYMWWLCYHICTFMQAFDLLFSLIVLIFSAIIHEVAHGYMALYLGDPTAKMSGRLTLNPVSHLDPFGSILLPLLLVFANTPFVFGYARPVPYNPYNLRGGKWGPALVAFAGPLSNLLIAFLFGLLFRFGVFTGVAAGAVFTIILINIVLGVFNLIPIAPLDGSKILFALLPYNLRGVEVFMNRYQLLLVLFILIFAWQPIVRFFLPVLLSLFTGLPF